MRATHGASGKQWRGAAGFSNISDRISGENLPAVRASAPACLYLCEDDGLQKRPKTLGIVV